MKNVLDFDGMHLVVPEAQIGPLMKALSKCIKVSWDYKSDAKDDEYFIDGPIEYRLKRVPDRQFKVRPGEADCTIEPEQKMIAFPRPKISDRQQRLLGE